MPQKDESINKVIKAKLDKDRALDLTLASGVMLYVVLLSILIFSLSIISTKDRVLNFFDKAGLILPEITRVMLSVSSMEYMFLCSLSGIFLIIKERFENKRLTLTINLFSLLGLWALEFAYVWSLAFALKPRG
jgi:hypothetical protein